MLIGKPKHCHIVSDVFDVRILNENSQQKNHMN